MSRIDTPGGRITESGVVSIDFDSFLQRVAAAPALQPALPNFDAGTMVGEHYRVDAEIGAGGMGTVFRATDVRLGRPVALKVHKRPSGHPGLELLRVEARALAHLTHPNVIEVFEIGAHEDRLFIAMEFVDGGTLEAWQADRTAAEIIELYSAAGEGLAAAHRAGLVHRDFKPANVLVGRDGRPRVADFGLVLDMSAQREESVPDPSTAVDVAEADSARLEGLSAHAMVGTPRYMAPEQSRGHGADHRSDQYALCISLFEALAGDVPTQPLVDLPNRAGVRPAVWTALSRGLAEDPDQRYPNIDLLLSALRDATKPPKRARWVALAGFGASAIAAMGVSSSATLADQCQREARATVATWGVQRARMDEALLAREDSTRAAAFAAQLDDYAARWLSAREQACATTVNDDRRDVSMRCLSRHARSLEDVIAVVADTPPEAADPPRTLPLPSLARCTSDTAAVVARAPLDAETAGAVDDVLAIIEKKNALVWNGELKAARVQAQDALRQANALQHKPTLVTALLGAGDVELESGRLEASHAYYEQGFYLAQSLGLDDEAALAGGSLVEILQDLGDLPAADRWTNHALSALDRLGERGEESTEIAVLSSIGNLRSHQGRFEDALEIQERLLSMLPTEGDEVRRSKAHNSLGATLATMGELEPAVEHFELAIALNDAARGPDHPDNVYPLANLAWMLIELEEFDRAEPLLDRAIAILRDKTADDAYALVTLLSHRGSLHDEQGEHAAARKLFAQGLEIAKAELGDEHDLAGMLLNNLASSFEGTGEIERARETYAEAIRVLERAGNPDDEILVLARNNLSNLASAD